MATCAARVQGRFWSVRKNEKISTIKHVSHRLRYRVKVTKIAFSYVSKTSIVRHFPTKQAKLS